MPAINQEGEEIGVFSTLPANLISEQRQPLEAILQGGVWNPFTALSERF